MRKNFKNIFILTFVLLLCFVITGCKKCKKDTPKEYQVTFISENQTLSTKKVEEGYKLVETDFPTTPTKEGFDFEGWYKDSLKVGTGFVINEDTNIVANFKKKVDVVIEDGSKENPYLIKTAADLITLSDRMNHLDEETVDPNIYKANFKLVNDIDMTGVNFTPIGKEIVIEKENVQETISGFMGTFDGNGHSIKNLNISINMRTNKTYYGGLFGITKNAYIHSLKLENINYVVESGSDTNERTIVMGGVAGFAELSYFEDVYVSGIINTKIFESNQAHFGGIAGAWHVSDSEKAYFAYVRNCRTNIETLIGEIEGETCSLESATNGGLFGYVYNYNAAVAVINCVTEGKIYGGKYVGGLVGTFSSSNVSILDSASYATVYGTGNEVSYVGGLVGMTSGDTIIKDSFYNGPVVRGTRATSQNYQSYAGGLVGYGYKDDYEMYYTAGLVCVNSYYKTIVRGSDNISDFGISMDNDVTIDFVKNTLKWDENSWKQEGNIIVPVHKKLDDCVYKINLIVDGNIVETLDRPIENGSYSLFGNLEDGDNDGSNIFYNWQIIEGSQYRFYMPVTKDINVYGKYQDVSEISGIYTGTGTLHETINAGIIVLNNDGTLKWINSSSVGGKYKYDGEHIIFEVYNNNGIVSGTIKDGKFEFMIDAGMSGTVSYSFTKGELTIFGEYFSETGDIITFGSEGKISYQSTNLKDGNYLNGNYTQEGDLITVTSQYLSSTFTEMSIIDNGDLTLTVNFISKDPNIPSLENVKFSKILTKDYNDYAFIGEYTFSYVGVSSSVTQTHYNFKFNADGTCEYISQFSNTMAEYYVFNDGKTIKVVLEGYASEFTYDEEGDFFYGILNRGTTGARRGIVITPVEDGVINGLVIGDEANVLFVTDNDSYLFRNGKYQKDAVINVPSIEDGSRIFIDNESYIVNFQKSIYTTYTGYLLLKVGNEEGDYQYNNAKFHLDGIGNVSGDILGKYDIRENNLLVIITENDEIIGFNYQDAKSQNGVVSLITPDTYQGVWYYDKTSTGEVSQKYYRLIVDGYGYASFMYLKNDEKTGELVYAHNWGSTIGWVKVTETISGLSCDFNEHQHCEMRFYYNGNLMYSTAFGYMGTIAMYKEGYTGSMVPPTLPSTATGRFVGVDNNNVAVVLNLRQDLNGSFAGFPFTAIFDGNESVVFIINSVTYTFNINTLVLNYNNQSITLRSDGTIQEIIPEALCGVWGGTWEGMGVDDKTTLKIEKDGTITYVAQVFTNAVVDYETMTITATATNSADETMTMVIVYDSETSTINVTYTFIYDTEEYTIVGRNLTLQ